MSPAKTERPTTVAETNPDSDRTIVLRSGTFPLAGAPPDLAHVLLLRQNDTVPRRIPLGATPLRIGHAAQNDLVLDLPEVSRQHCVISIDNGVAALADLNSTNGVHVDGSRIAGEARLSPGAWIGIGPFTLHYHRGSPRELAEAEAAEHEMARAMRYIEALLPPPMRDGAVHAEWRFVPSAQLGGDAFGYRWLDTTHFAVFLLDVSGHGLRVGAAGGIGRQHAARPQPRRRRPAQSASGARRYERRLSDGGSRGPALFVVVRRL